MNEVGKVQVEKNETEQKVVSEPVAQKPYRRMHAWFPWAVAGLGALLIAMVSYSVGYHATLNSPVRGNLGGNMMRNGFDDHGVQGGAGFRGRGMISGVVGEVTAIGSDSITIKDAMRGGSVTYKIDGNTKVTENGTAKVVSDIKTGNTVRVSATGGDTIIATSIILGTNW